MSVVYHICTTEERTSLQFLISGRFKSCSWQRYDYYLFHSDMAWFLHTSPNSSSPISPISLPSVLYNFSYFCALEQRALHCNLYIWASQVLLQQAALYYYLLRNCMVRLLKILPTPPPQFLLFISQVSCISLYLPKPPTYFPPYSSPAAAAMTRIPMFN